MAAFAFAALGGPWLRWAHWEGVAIALLGGFAALGWGGFSSGEATSDGGKGRAARSSAADRQGRIVRKQPSGEDCLSTAWPFPPARDNHGVVQGLA